MEHGKPAQIPLPFRQYDNYDLEQYWPGENRHVLDHLWGVSPGGDSTLTYLWGESGTGKSHLLQAMCTRFSNRTERSAYIPLEQRDLLTPQLVEGLEQLDLVCVDDLEVIAGDAEWEHAVFNLFNRLQENGKTVIFTATLSPRGIPIMLSDLQSRLEWCVIFRLTPLNEADRLAALKQRAAVRGIELSDDVTGYLIRRVPRDTHNLFRLLDRLDQASLAAKKKLTVPFVRQLLESKE